MDNYPIHFATWLRDEINKSSKDIEKYAEALCLNPDNHSIKSLLDQTVGKNSALLSARHRFEIEINQK